MKYLIFFHLFFFSLSCFSDELIFATVENQPLVPKATRIIQEAYAKLGHTIKVKEYPALRSIMLANNGTVDGELGRISGIDSSYSNLEMIPIPISVLNGVVFSRKLDVSIKGWESLGKNKIGILRGIVFSEFLAKGMNIEYADSPEQLMRMLDHDRIDLAIIEKTQGLAVLKKLSLNNIRELEPPLITIPLYHYLNKKHHELVPQITDILTSMHSTGRIKFLNEQPVDSPINTLQTYQNPDK